VPRQPIRTVTTPPSNAIVAGSGAGVLLPGWVPCPGGNVVVGGGVFVVMSGGVVVDGVVSDGVLDGVTSGVEYAGAVPVLVGVFEAK
jgi:hypothetical protein